MPNPKKLMASVAIAAGLLGGGVAGVVLGVPGVSGAQTTTVPDAPSTPAPDQGQTNPDRPPRGDGDCPGKAGGGGTAPAAGATGTNLGFHRGGAGGRI
jgi:hypothetical protein